MVETHISVLGFVGDLVYKLKKPVAMSVLDWRTRAARESACHREVELNRRLAPDVYLGVVDVVRDDGPAAGEVVDHLVVMRRMPADRRLSALVRAGADVGPGLRDLAGLLAGFHRDATRRTTVAGAEVVDAVRAHWDDNLSALRGFPPDLVDPVTVERIATLAHRYLDGRGSLFAARADAGLVVDGHGDLLADDVFLLADGPRVLDCLEFSDALRTVDVLDDVCFLAMDLERCGAPDAAATFLDAYGAVSGEHHPASLAHHYIAYRAGVRAKVGGMRVAQGGDDADAVRADVRVLGEIARAHLEAGRVRLVAVGGLPGTGKSTVAAGLAAATGWPVLHSDLVRKELAGVDPATSLRDDWQHGAYTPERTAAVYDELLARARMLLAHGESVILDASWTAPEHRSALARAAEVTSSDLLALECVAPPEVASGRIAARAQAVGSDATPAVAAVMAAVSPGPWPDAVVLDTTSPPDAVVRRAQAVVEG